MFQDGLIRSISSESRDQSWQDSKALKPPYRVSEPTPLSHHPTHKTSPDNAKLIKSYPPTHCFSVPFQQFQVLFNSLFKVLCIFPSRYLFAIGLPLYLALDGIYHPLWAAIPNNSTRRKPCRTLPYISKNGTITLHGALFQETYPRTYTDNDFYRLQFATKARDFQSELFPLHSPLLRESWLVSFPPLIICLNSAGILDW